MDAEKFLGLYVHMHVPACSQGAVFTKQMLGFMDFRFTMTTMLKDKI